MLDHLRADRNLMGDASFDVCVYHQTCCST